MGSPEASVGHESRKHLLFSAKKRIKAYAALGVFASGVIVATAKIVYEDHFDTCDGDPSKAELARVREQIKGIQFTGYDSYEGFLYLQDEELKNRQVDAKRNGVTIFDHRPYYITLLEDVGKPEDEQLPFSDYFTSAKAFLNKYNIQLVIGQDDQKYKYEGRPLNSEEVETIDAKEQIITLLEDFARLPSEFVRDTGVKKVVLVKLFGGVGGYIDYAFPGVIYADPTNSGRTKYRHELYHLYDRVMCGDIYADRTYNDLNPTDIYKDPGSFKSIKDIDKLKQENRARDRAVYGKKDTKKIDQILEGYERFAKRVVVTDSYSLKDVAEDKATMGEILLSPTTYQSLFALKAPVLDEKFVLLAGRISKKNPNVWNYMVDASQVPHAK